MKVAFFSSKSYDRDSFNEANGDYNYKFTYLEPQLNPETAILAKGYPAVCIFVNDVGNAETLDILAEGGTKLLLLRSAGYNHVDLKRAAELGIKIARVPSYSPNAVAEHAVALILSLNRKIHRAYNRVRDDNFSLEGLLGFDMNGRTVGVIGTGKIGLVFSRIIHGFGCSLLGYDAYPNEEFKTIGDSKYVSLPELFSQSDIISLHCPLLPETHYIINAESIAQMKDGVMLINTSRGALMDTRAVIDGIKAHKIGSLGIDVYEQEDELFFQDLSNTIIQDETFQLLQSFPNVLITAHQAFFTCNALEQIATVTLFNLTQFEKGETSTNEVVYKP